MFLSSFFSWVLFVVGCVSTKLTAENARRDEREEMRGSDWSSHW